MDTGERFQTVPDTLEDSLIIFGNEAAAAARFTDLLAAGLDELMVRLILMTNAVDDEQAGREVVINPRCSFHGTS